MDLSELYAQRFDSRELKQKARAWTVLYEKFFHRWISPDDTVLDLGAGRCEFINAVKARRRIAYDATPDTARLAVPGVEVLTGSAAQLSAIGAGEIDFVFASNFLEHLPDKKSVAELVTQVHRVLRPGGRFVVMGPNARVIPGAYWDFFDHHVPLTERSLGELLLASAFSLEQVEARFIPYTVKRFRMPIPRWLICLFLALRPISSALFGQQFLIVAQKEK